MKAYQCSKCKKLEGLAGICFCSEAIEARPKKRVKGEYKWCKQNFEPLDEKDQWHKPFYWEKR